MPRVTRKSVAESPAESPARMSPRASTKASTTSSRSSRSTTSASTPAASPRTPRLRGGKSPEGEDPPAEKEAAKSRTSSRGRQQKPAGDAGTPEEVQPEKTGRGRTSVKAQAKGLETGRSRSRAKPTKDDSPTEETSNTSSRSRSRTKTEETPVVESGRVSRSKLKGKEDSEEQEAPDRASSRSRSSNKDKADDTKVTNSRNRRGGKADDSTKAETSESNQTKSRSRSRTKAEPKVSPEIETESSRSRGKGRAPKSPTNESVGSSRSSSRSRTSKAQSDDISEPVEVKEKESKVKGKPNGSAKMASKRSGPSKAVGKELEEKSDVTPTGRRSGRSRKVEASPATPSKKRRVQEKSASPKDDEDEKADDDKDDEQLEKPEKDKMEDENDESEKMEVDSKSEKQKPNRKESEIEVEKKSEVAESMETGEEGMDVEENTEAVDDKQSGGKEEDELEKSPSPEVAELGEKSPSPEVAELGGKSPSPEVAELGEKSPSPEVAELEEKFKSPTDIELKSSVEEQDSTVISKNTLEEGPKPTSAEEDNLPADDKECSPAAEEEESRPAALEEETIEVNDICQSDARKEDREPATAEEKYLVDSVEKESLPKALEEKLEPAAADKDSQSDTVEEECPSDAVNEESRPIQSDTMEENLEPTAADEDSSSDAVKEESQPSQMEENLDPAAAVEVKRSEPVKEESQPSPVDEVKLPEPVKEESQPSPVEENLEPAAADEEYQPQAVDELYEPDAVDATKTVVETFTAVREPELQVIDQVTPEGEKNDIEEFKSSVGEPEVAAEERESKSPEEEVADNSHEGKLETEELMNSQKKQVENMDVDETYTEPVMSSQISSSGGHGLKRKLDDSAFDESSNKRVCVDEEEKEQVVESTSKSGGEPLINDAPQAVIQETSHPGDSIGHMVQQPAIEAISDVSSAEEDMTCSADVQKEPVNRPVVAVASQGTWQVPQVTEAEGAAVESNDRVTESGHNPVVSETDEVPVPSSTSEEAEPSSEELLQAGSLDPGKTMVDESPHKTSESVEGSIAEGSVEQKDEDDLTASYVIVSMDDVPHSDSALVKDILPGHQNHADNSQNADSQLQKESSMEVDPGLASDEQKKAMDTTGTVTKTDTCEIATENNTMSKTSDTCVPAADPSKESIKSDIVKPVRNFEPSPDIFHRSCVCNPSLDPESVPVSHKFTVASYNILAECHRKRGDYSYTEEKYLEQEYRHQLLMKELQYLDADIVCLQEVNPEYYNTHLQPSLHSIGYQSSFMKRTWTDMDEGEATFVKTSRFTIESTKGFSLAELSKKNISESGLSTEVQTAVEEYLDRADVVNICRLRCKQTDKVLTVGNIHVVYDHLRSPDIQAIQIATAVKEVVSQASSDICPHVLCGDFNSVPSSVGYQLAQDGYLTDSNIATLQAVENLKLQSGSRALVNHLWGAFQHTSSNLNSAYHTCQGEEPEVTTFTRNMFECVDYLLYGSVSLGVADVLRVVDKHVLQDCKGLPAQEIPSDHLSLKATFFFK